MAIYNYTKINVGGQANDGTGDNIRDAFVKVNNALDTVFTLGGTNPILTEIYSTLTLYKAILDATPSLAYVDASTATVLATTATSIRTGTVKLGADISASGDGTINVVFPTYTVSGLPNTGLIAGMRAFVSDCQANIFNTAVSGLGGGSNFVPVFCDNALVWRIG